ncbi:MAG TPA: ATP-binding protein, partial [Ktedonobacterales bacterium]
MARSKKLPLECPALIGREAELETLEQLLAEAAAGSGRLALISGADGAGRTCLLAELGQRVNLRQPFLWQAAGWPYDAICPYATLLRLCESAHAGAGEEEQEQGDSASADGAAPGGAAPGGADLQRAVATVAACVAAETPAWDVFANAAPVDPGDERRRCLRLLLDGLRQVSASGPVLITLDDAHLADEMTWAFLRELAPLLPRLPLLVVLAYRDEPAPPDALLATIAALARWTAPTRLPLAPLAPGESAALARALLPPRESLSPTLEAALFAVARGQPYAVASLLAVWRAEEAAGAAAGGPGAAGAKAIPLPQSAREAVRWQVARLSARARDLLAELAITRG